jgi:hypothetical protein
MKNDIKQAVLFASDARGIYIPQHFAESYNSEQWNPIDADDLAILLHGPEHESYWDAWCEVLDSAETICGGSLHQDGDLWVIWHQLAIDAIDAHCAAQLDYEESHDDAGDAYSHMIAESWTSTDDDGLRKNLIGPDVQFSTKDGFDVGYWVPKWTVDSMGLDPDILSEIAIDLFVMQRGSILGCYTDGIVLGAFPVGEIEVQLDDLGIDGITLDLVRESCDAYINDSGYAYLTTDAVWFAVVCPVAFQAAIADYVKDANR